MEPNPRSKYNAFQARQNTFLLEQFNCLTDTQSLAAELKTLRLDLQNLAEQVEQLKPHRKT